MNKDPTRADEDLFRRLKILVVEDSLEMQRLLVALLESMGVVHIAVARDGEKGLAAFAARRPDIIITDGAMVPMDGYEMTRRIRAAEAGGNANPDVPILMISGHAGRENVTHARDQGVTDYLTKPLSADTLYEAIVAAVSKPVHFLDKPGYRGLSPKRSLDARRS
ncbi:response regulator [Parvibaculum sp.]|jgi:two-component system, chemotaxis family, chemotaxis protein CheY|uniref:response regulator n=1 Tax=Parvibaculum sp. TaxID=2024848 RepID=UPI000C3AD109|nr:response regulator [Parvibaculum sp.]MAM94331.1 two-component system response regulator [Parvibaculum sp.]|tara:strand:- start:55270 stop:55764 length:495 start_codon:yes stop_codon:yes gene_type:complete